MPCRAAEDRRELRVRARPIARCARRSSRRPGTSASSSTVSSGGGSPLGRCAASARSRARAGRARCRPTRATRRDPGRPRAVTRTGIVAFSAVPNRCTTRPSREHEALARLVERVVGAQVGPLRDDERKADARRRRPPRPPRRSARRSPRGRMPLRAISANASTLHDGVATSCRARRVPTRSRRARRRRTGRRSRRSRSAYTTSVCPSSVERRPLAAALDARDEVGALRVARDELAGDALALEEPLQEDRGRASRGRAGSSCRCGSGPQGASWPRRAALRPSNAS